MVQSITQTHVQTVVHQHGSGQIKKFASNKIPCPIHHNSVYTHTLGMWESNNALLKDHNSIVVELTLNMQGISFLLA